MVKSACPGGVNTLKYLKHPISLHSIHNRCLYHVPLASRLIMQIRFTIYKHALDITHTPCQCKFYKKTCANKKKTSKIVWFSLYVFWGLVNYAVALNLRHPMESFSDSVQSDCCRRSLNMNSNALDIVIISYMFDFSTSRRYQNQINKFM